MTRFTTAARFGASASILCTIASGFLAMTPPAFAADDDNIPQARLNVAGTDFTSAKAIAELKSRIRRTALDICTTRSDGKTLMSPDQRKCYDTAMHTGLAQIEGRQLAALRQTTTNIAAAQPEEHLTH